MKACFCCASLVQWNVHPELLFSLFFSPIFCSMVFFICNACNESLKKNQVGKHYQQKCRRCEFLSCIDCGKEFWWVIQWMDNYFSSKVHIPIIYMMLSILLQLVQEKNSSISVQKMVWTNKNYRQRRGLEGMNRDTLLKQNCALSKWWSDPDTGDKVPGQSALKLWKTVWW